MIRAIIFDWGGVLVDDPKLELMTYCAKSLEVTKEAFIQTYNKVESEFQKGTISEAELWKKICYELGVLKPKTSSLWGDAFRQAYSPKKEMFSLASILHNRGYKIGLLSNTEVPMANYFYEQGYDMIDEAIFSCVERIRKPDRKIYEIACERLKIQPREGILFDDKIEYVDGAKAVGLNACLFKNPTQVKRVLTSFSVNITP